MLLICFIAIIFFKLKGNIGTVHAPFYMNQIINCTTIIRGKYILVKNMHLIPLLWKI